MYMDFLEEWGTHFSLDITMGSRFSQLIEFELAAFNRAKRDGFNSIKASQAEFLFLGQTKRSRLSASDQDLQRQFDHASYSRKLVCYGAQGRCPDGKNMSHWRAASMKDPMPLVANFRPILSLFTAEYFEDPHILGKREGLAKLMNQTYCRREPSCAVVVPEMYITEATQLPRGAVVRSAAIILQDTLYAMSILPTAIRPRWLMWWGDSTSTYHALYKYDHKKVKWDHVKGVQLPGICDYAVAASSRLGRIYILGGFREAWVVSDHVYEMKPVQGEVLHAGSFGRRAFGLGAVIVSDLWLYAIGGGFFESRGHHWPWYATANVTAFEIYNRSWVPMPDLGKKRVWPAVAAHDGVIYVVGGTSTSRDDRAPTTAERFNIMTRSWVRLAARCSPRIGAGMAVAAGQLWLFGGFSVDARGDYRAIETAEHLHLTTSNGTTWQLAAAFMTGPRAFVSAVTDASSTDIDRVLLVGGKADPASVHDGVRTVEVWSLPAPRF